MKSASRRSRKPDARRNRPRVCLTDRRRIAEIGLGRSAEERWEAQMLARFEAAQDRIHGSGPTIKVCRVHAD